MQPNTTISPAAQSAYIPDSLDALTLNGIVPYDVNAFIYDRESRLPIPKNYSPGFNTLNNDKYDPKIKQKKQKHNHKNLKTLGAAALTVASATVVILGLKGKLPKVDLKQTLNNAFQTVKKGFTKK